MVGLRRFQRALPRALHDKLKWVKYLSSSPCLRFRCSRWAGRDAGRGRTVQDHLPGRWFERSWPSPLFAGRCSGCRSSSSGRSASTCPLGASLRCRRPSDWFGLRRKQEVHHRKACAGGLRRAGHRRAGRIDHRECLHCLDCMILYTDTHACPPLARTQAARARRGLRCAHRPRRLLHSHPSGAGRSAGGERLNPMSIRACPTEPFRPPTRRRARRLRLVCAQTWDHLWPWRRAWRRRIWAAPPRRRAGAGRDHRLGARTRWVEIAPARSSAGGSAGASYEVLVR